MSADTIPSDEDDTHIPNLAPNACPITPLLVAMIEYVQPVKLRSMRLRDSWLAPGASGPTVNFALAIGGGLRGGDNGSLWGRLRMHPLYIADADLGQAKENADVLVAMPNWASVTFLVPSTVARVSQRLLEGVPNLTHDPVRKLREGMHVATGRASAETIKGAANTLSEVEINRGLQVLAALVETLKQTKA